MRNWRKGCCNSGSKRSATSLKMFKIGLLSASRRIVQPECAVLDMAKLCKFARAKDKVERAPKFIFLGCQAPVHRGC